MFRRRAWRHLVPYALVCFCAGIGIALLLAVGEYALKQESISWVRPKALYLLAAVPLLCWVLFHLQLRRSGVFLFSRVADLKRSPMGWVAVFARVPAVLRIVAVSLLVVALARPQTFKVESLEVEGIDIMVVLDLSKSMEETDLKKNRLDAGQRTVRNFVRRRQGDRVGLVVFAREAMLQSPLTLDYDAFENIVANLAIGDVPEKGTAIGDALGLALGSLKRADSTSKVIVLVSDGDSNTSSYMDPYEAKEIAAEMGVRVFTVLMGADADGERPPSHAVNPSLLQEIAADTSGRFFRVGADEQLDASFESIRADLEKSRTVVKGQIPDRELFGWLVTPALLLLLLELVLRKTRWRRFP